MYKLATQLAPMRRTVRCKSMLQMASMLCSSKHRSDKTQAARKYIKKTVMFAVHRHA